MVNIIPRNGKFEARRRASHRSYIATILQRDIANIERLTDMPRLLALLAARTASQLIPFGERLHAVPVQALWSLGGAA
jgi:hypothetical protein